MFLMHQKLGRLLSSPRIPSTMVEALSSPSLTQVRREARLCHNLHFLVYISEIRSRFREKLILTPMGIKGFLRGHLFSPFCQDFKVKNVKERFLWTPCVFVDMAYRSSENVLVSFKQIFKVLTRLPAVCRSPQRENRN